jgi:uncharacterized Zn-binding protein involved in type VI secretion
MTFAVRQGDMHTCPAATGPVPHVGGPVVTGLPTVLIGNLPAARVGDVASCAGPPDAFTMGAFTVKLGGMPAVRTTDMTAHGGKALVGCPTVMIGDSPQAVALLQASHEGADFCAICEGEKGA